MKLTQLTCQLVYTQLCVGALNLQDMKMTDQITGLENARPGK